MEGLQTYKRKIGIFWWTKRLSHFRFISRELTSIAVAFIAIELLLLSKAIMNGEESYQAFVQSLTHPILIILNLIALGGILYHSITWFNLAPKAMVIKLGENKVPGFLIALGNYLGWIVISAIIVWSLL